MGRRVHLTTARLGRRGEIDEESDENEDRKAVKQAEEAERESKGLADMRGDARRLVRRVEPHGESGAQHAPAVHRKGGNHVEEREEQIRRGESFRPGRSGASSMKG